MVANTCLTESNGSSKLALMRWDNLRIDSTSGNDADPASAGGTPVGGTLPLIERNAIVRTFDTPGFRGMTFYEVQAKSIVSKVPASSWSRSPIPSIPIGDVNILALIASTGKRRS